MGKKTSTHAFVFILTFVATAATAILLAIWPNTQSHEAAAIILMIPLIWAYMTLPLRGMILCGAIVGALRVLVEAIQMSQNGMAIVPRNLARETIFPLLLYAGLAIPFFLYRQRQAALVAKLVKSGSMEARDRLASSLTHDFNNVLNVIVGTSELLSRDKTLSLQAARDVNTITTAGQQGLSLIRQMRHEVAGDIQGQAQHRVLCDLSDVVARQMDLIGRMLEPHLTIQRQFTDVRLPVRIDVGQLLRVLMNLCLNARDAMPQGGTLTVRTAVSYFEGRPFARLAIADTGVGIDPKIRPRLFEPFFTTRAQEGGVGLGLSIVQSIVNSHGGIVEVQSAPAQGATFNVLLPMETSDQAQPIRGV